MALRLEGFARRSAWWMERSRKTSQPLAVNEATASRPSNFHRTLRQLTEGRTSERASEPRISHILTRSELNGLYSSSPLEKKNSIRDHVVRQFRQQRRRRRLVVVPRLSLVAAPESTFFLRSFFKGRDRDRDDRRGKRTRNSAFM